MTNTSDLLGPHPSEARVVVVLIHGRGQDGPIIIDMTRGITDADDVAWIAPTAPDNTWYPDGFMKPWEVNEPAYSSSVRRFTELLDKLNADGVDDRRVVLMGFSQGACLVAELARQRPRQYGAVVVFTGGFCGPPETVWEPPVGLEGVPVFIGTSDSDDWVPLERCHDTAAIFRAAGTALDYRVYEGMEHIINDDELAAAQALIEAL